MRFVAKHIIIIVSTVTCLVACNNHSANWETLNSIETIIDQNPDSALSLLKGISSGTLSESDRYYYHFLMVKAKDKAIIDHTSDSLICIVHEYYSENETYRYPEVVYYCGRVYNDLGDFPTALNYYQDALELIPSKPENLKLRGAVLCQTAYLLNSLRLYNEAIPYIQESIKIDSVLSDSINLMHDTKLLGAIYMHLKNYVDAETMFESAKKIAANRNPADLARINVYLAAINLFTDDIDSARILIRQSINNLRKIDRNFGLAYATHIYLKSSILDTAYLYANELVRSGDSSNKATGYQTLLSPKLRGFISHDSLHSIVTEYRWLLENSLNKNESQAALIQNSYYNYQIHERERLKAEENNDTLQKWIYGCSFLVFVFMLITLYLKYRNKSQQLQLQKAINDVSVLRQIIRNSSNPNQGQSTNITISSKADINTLRTKLGEELLMIINENKSIKTPAAIEESDVYKTISQYIQGKQVIPEEHKLWSEIEDIVIKSSPDFKYRLQLLVGDELKKSDLHMALLIKCGIKPTNISILVGRAKATIAYRRETLGTKFFGRKMDISTIDKIIRLL